MQITPVSNALGANVSDVALDELTDDQAAQLVGAVRARRAVLRDRHLPPGRHKAFARRFGDIDINRFFNAVDGHPDRRSAQRSRPDRQHRRRLATDPPVTPHRPAARSCAHEIPPIGDDTCFIGMGAAYDASVRRYRTCTGSLAAHSGAHVFGRQSPTNARPTASVTPMPFATTSATRLCPPRHRPADALRRTRASPRRSTAHDPEFRALLGFLFEHCQRPEFQIRFEWLPSHSPCGTTARPAFRRERLPRPSAVSPSHPRPGRVGCGLLMLVGIVTGNATAESPNLVTDWAPRRRLGLVPEAWMFDSLTPAAYLAGRTETMRLGTACVQLGRVPLRCSPCRRSRCRRCRTVDSFSEWARATRRSWRAGTACASTSRSPARETVEIINRIASGERVSYEGRPTNRCPARASCDPRRHVADPDVRRLDGAREPAPHRGDEPKLIGTAFLANMPMCMLRGRNRRTVARRHRDHRRCRAGVHRRHRGRRSPPRRRLRLHHWSWGRRRRTSTTRRTPVWDSERRSTRSATLGCR